MKVYKFPLRPTSEQAEAMVAVLDETRNLYNHFLETTIKDHSKGKKYPGEYGLSVRIPKLKKKLKIGSHAHHHCLQMVAKRLHLAFQAFFRRAKAGEKPGFPRFQSWRRWSSFAFKQHGNGFRFLEDQGLLRLSNVGLVKVNNHRPVKGNVKTLVVKRDNLGRWWATITTDEVSKKLRSNKRTIGIDFGLKDLVVGSDKTIIARPSFLFRVDKQLLQVQRRFSFVIAKLKAAKSKKAKALWQAKADKYRRVLNHVWKKINNQRHNFVHQHSHALVKKYGRIALEDFQPANLRTKNNSRKGIRASLQNACLTFLKTSILYKAENAGREVVLVPAKNTTRRCNCCGVIGPKLELSQRAFECENCGHADGRDLNAAKNVRDLAFHPNKWDLDTNPRANQARRSAGL